MVELKNRQLSWQPMNNLNNNSRENISQWINKIHCDGALALLKQIPDNTIDMCCTSPPYWSLLKRGIIGIYHSTSKKHLHRYCDEFTYRYNTRHISDTERFINVLTKSADARLTYKQLIQK